VDTFKAIKATENGTATYALQGRLDSNTSPRFEKELQSVFDEKLNLMLDCSELDYVSSVGLRVLLMAYKKANGNQTDFRLRNLKPEVREVMDMVGFSDILDIEQP